MEQLLIELSTPIALILIGAYNLWQRAKDSRLESPQKKDNTLSTGNTWREEDLV